MSDAEERADLERDFSLIAAALFAPGTVKATLDQIVRLAEAAVDGCAAAGVLIVDAEDNAHIVAGSRVANELDQAQIDTDEGPCLDAARTGATFYVEDMAIDERWPAFTAPVLAAGMRSILAYSLSAQTMSALNLYGELPTAFGATDRAKGQLFATLARLALDSAETHAADVTHSKGLREALRTRELIGQAQGILMERERITADQAFEVLRRASQHLNIKLRDVAADLVETGEAPKQPPTS